VIVHAVFFYVRYAVSYRDLEEILAERGVSVDHATPKSLGREIFAVDRRKCPNQKEAIRQLLADG